jgi:hypothetical protein
MIRALQIAHLLVLLAAVAVLGVVGWQGWVRGQQFGAALAGLETAEAKLNASLDKINQPGTGTLAEADKLSLAAKSVLVHVDIAAQHEDQNLTALDAQERTLFADAHGTMASLTGTADAATETLHSTTADLQTLNVSVAGLQPVEASASASFIDLDAFIKGPDVTGTAANVNLITGNFGKMSSDAQVKFHDLLYPPPCRSFACRFERGLNDVRLASQFVEPAYYFRQLLTGDTTQVSGTVNVQK